MVTLIDAGGSTTDTCKIPVDESCVASPLYSAVTLNVGPDVGVSDAVAFPLASTGTTLTSPVLERNVTVPVGVAVPATTAVICTGWLTGVGLAELERNSWVTLGGPVDVMIAVVVSTPDGPLAVIVTV